MAKFTEVLAMIATGSGGSLCAGEISDQSTASGVSTDRPSALILCGASRVVVALA